MEHLSLGADPHQLGVLSGGELDSQISGGGSFLLEDTLEKLICSSESTIETASQVGNILALLPHARAEAELGNVSVVPDIENWVLALAGNPDLKPGQRRRILEHLPAHLRPIPDSLSSLERVHPPVTLFVVLQGPDKPDSYYAKTPRIKLSDIVVFREPRGKGLGTAALTELCMYADLNNLPIEGMLEPGPGESDETVVSLSRWYARMGFTQGDREPPQWVRGDNIYRSPRPYDLQNWR